MGATPEALVLYFDEQPQFCCGTLAGRKIFVRVAKDGFDDLVRESI